MADPLKRASFSELVQVIKALLKDNEITDYDKLTQYYIERGLSNTADLESEGDDNDDDNDDEAKLVQLPGTVEEKSEDNSDLDLNPDKDRESARSDDVESSMDSTDEASLEGTFGNYQSLPEVQNHNEMYNGSTSFKDYVQIGVMS